MFRGKNNMKFKKIIISGITMLSIFGMSAGLLPTNTEAATTTNVAKVQASARQDTNYIFRLDYPDNVTVKIDKGLSAQVKNAIKYSMDQWNSTKLVKLSMYSAKDDAEPTIVMTNDNSYKDSWGTSINTVQDTDNPDLKKLITTKISIDAGLRYGFYDDSAVEHTIMHEMGHALGLDDNYVDPNSTMYYTSDYITSSDPTVKLNASDYQALKQLYFPNN